MWIDVDVLSTLEIPAGAHGPSSKLVVGAVAIHLPSEGDETFGGGLKAFGAPWRDRRSSIQILNVVFPWGVKTGYLLGLQVKL